jgi:hypothetical protein
MEREVGMNGHDILGGILVFKAGIDTIKSLAGWFPAKKSGGGLIPVYHLVRAKPAKTDPPAHAIGTEISKAAPAS